MPTITVSRTIPAEVDRVWSALRDFGATSAYNPAIHDSRSLGEIREGVGAQRHCDINASGSKYVIEEIVAWDGDARRYTIEMVDGPSRPPVEKFLVDIGAIATDAGRTEVTMTATMTTTGLVQKAMGAMAGPMLRKVFGQVLAGLEHHVSTGESVRDVKQLKAAGVQV